MPGDVQSPGRRVLALVCLLLAAVCGRRAPAPAHESATANPDSVSADSAAHATGAQAPTRIEIVDVDLHVFEDATVHVRWLEGIVAGNPPGEPIPLDDPRSYVIEVESGEAWIGYSDLSLVMNGYTFAFDGAPLGHLEMAREEDDDELDRIELKGRLESGIGLSFEIEGTPEATRDGKIRIRTKAIQALEIPVGGLMHALGLDAADLIGNMEERGLTFDGDDMILDASRALPPPRMRGPITVVRVEEDGLRLTFGPARAGPAVRTNYLKFRHGVIKIGRMTQYDADLTITDADPRDTFDFFGEQMNRQLAAGYSKMSDTGALTMVVPDFVDMQRGQDLP
jgi:hypothetical protein